MFNAKWACHVDFENPQVTQKIYNKTMEQLVNLIQKNSILNIYIQIQQ